MLPGADSIGILVSNIESLLPYTMRKTNKMNFKRKEFLK